MVNAGNPPAEPPISTELVPVREHADLDQQFAELIEYIFAMERAQRFEDRLDSMLGLVPAESARHRCYVPEGTFDWSWTCPDCSLAWHRQLSGGWLPKV